MKKLRIVLVALMAAITVLSFSACGSKKVKLTFEVNGGTPISSVELEKDKEYTLPNAVREGHEFDGWYLTSNFSGDPVTKVKIDKNTTVYAKWIRLYKIELNLDGGTLSTSSLMVRAGTNVLDYLADYVPTKAGDYLFGAWFNGATELDANFVMPDSDITLTAKYKIKYTVEVHLEDIDGESFLAPTSYVGHGYVGTTPTHNLSGFTIISGHPSNIAPKALTETASENAFRLYYSRNSVSVLFNVNYPNTADANQAVQTQTGNFEAPLTVLHDYHYEGYYLAGWSTSKNGEILYKTNYIETQLYLSSQRDENATPDETTFPATQQTLYGVWAKGYTDLFGGEDYIFVAPEHNDVVYLSRAGVLFKGTLNPTTKVFTFRDESGVNIMLRGLLASNYTYSYSNSARGITYYLRKPEVGTPNKGITLVPDAYNGITYSASTSSGTSTSKGEYYIDSQGLCIATFTSGDLIGQTLTIVLGKSGGEDVFNIRDDQDYNLGMLTCFLVSGSSVIANPLNTMQIELTGLGVANMHTSSTSSTQYYYTHEKSTGIVTLMDLSSGEVFEVVRIVERDGQKGYMFYDTELARTFTSANQTLTLDGMSQATYFDGTNNITGIYTSKESAFTEKAENGTVTKACSVITLTTSANRTYTFLTTVSGTTTKTYTFERKGDGYAEYYFRDENGSLFHPLLVIESTTNATVYADTETAVYKKALEGTYTFDETTGKYIFLASGRTEVPDAVTTPPSGTTKLPIDLYTIESFVFSLDTLTTTRNVHYWHSHTLTAQAGGTTENAVIKEYTNADTSETDSKLILIAGFAIFNDSEFAKSTYTYSISGNFVILSVGSYYTYLEVDEANSTFVRLSNVPRTYTFRRANGTSTTNITLALDGKGYGTYTVRDGGTTTTYFGRISDPSPNAFGTEVFTFTQIDPSTKVDVLDGETFNFVTLSSAGTATTSYYFATYNEDYNGTYTFGSRTLVLDGFGLVAKYTDASGKISQYNYIISSGNTARIIIDGYYTFVDLNTNETGAYEAGKFAIRGEEYGNYIYMNNNAVAADTYFEFDGRNKVVVFDYDREEDGTIKTDANGASMRKIIDAAGTYSISAGTGLCTISYSTTNEATKDVTLVGRITTVNIGGTDINAFVKAYGLSENGIEGKYINEADWSILFLDDIGNVIKHRKDGIVENGTYVIVADGLLYYANDADDDAADASLYTYTKAATEQEFGKLEAITSLENKSYFSHDLGSIQFTKYGFVIFNGDTASRAYYNIDNGEVTLYLRTTESGHDFGFKTDTSIGSLIDTITYNTTNYHLSSGFDIQFNRDASELTGANNYPARLSKNDAKGVLKSLYFTPTGADEFSVSASAVIGDASAAIGDKTYTGTVTRTKTEFYATMENYRFYIDVEFKGLNTTQVTTNATFTVTDLRYVEPIVSNNFLSVYYYVSILQPAYASAMPNTFGTIYFVREYEPNGEISKRPGTDEDDVYINGEFALMSMMYDADGVLVAPQRAIYSENNGKYVTQFIAEDGLTYRIRFSVVPFTQLNNRLSYKIEAFTRVETFTSNGYTVEVERVVASDESLLSTEPTPGALVAGDFFSVNLYNGATVDAANKITIASPYDTILMPTYNMIYLVNRDASTTCYKIVFTEGADPANLPDGAQVLTPYASAAITPVTITNRLATNNSVSHVEMSSLSVSGFEILCFNGVYYAVESATLDDSGANNVYTVTVHTGDKFTVTMAKTSPTTITISRAV